MRIKKYTNRKLYAAKLKRYVSVKEVFEMYRSGQEVLVLTHQGRDITKETVMSGLVESGGEVVDQILKFIRPNDPV